MKFWDLAHPSDAVALIDEFGQPVSYGVLRERVGRAADRLRQMGDRLVGALDARNSVSFVVAYLACLQAGHVPLLLSPSLPDLLRARLYETYQPDWLLGTEAPGDPLPGSGLKLAPRSPRATAPIHPQLGLLLSTSGSTGSARLVRLSYDALQANAESIVGYLGLEADDCAASTMPPHYSYGLSVLHSHLAVGARMLVTDQGVLERSFWERSEQAGITSLSGVPYLYQLLHRTEFERRELPTLRRLTQAGGRLDDRLTRHFLALSHARGWRFFVMYGQTEATARISYVPPERLPQKIGSIGVAVPGGALSIDAESGELVYRGPNVMLGYATSRADLALGDTQGGLLATGELAHQDEDGYFYLSGRLKRFVKLGGHRISLDEVEHWLQETLAIPVAVTGGDDQLVACTESAEREVLARARRLLAERLRLHQSFFRVIGTRDLPLLANGKKDYAAVLAHLHAPERKVA